MEKFDIIIVGGGAAGFFAAINTAQMNPDLSIVILERGNAVLSKVKISGGGRCNVTHAEFIPNELVTYYPGEILNIDGVTGGFNFQNAWTGAYIAAQELSK